MTNSDVVRLQKLYEFLNMTAKSGVVNIRPVMKEICEILRLDPRKVLTSD